MMKLLRLLILEKLRKNKPLKKVAKEKKQPANIILQAVSLLVLIIIIEFNYCKVIIESNISLFALISLDGATII
jgi:hypothetical protein